MQARAETLHSFLRLIDFRSDCWRNDHSIEPWVKIETTTGVFFYCLCAVSVAVSAKF